MAVVAITTSSPFKNYLPIVRQLAVHDKKIMGIASKDLRDWQDDEKGCSGGFTPPSRVEIDGAMAG
jgi:hypothetical protein